MMLSLGNGRPPEQASARVSKMQSDATSRSRSSPALMFVRHGMGPFSCSARGRSAREVAAVTDGAALLEMNPMGL
jgi:hypothetical protein